MFSAQYHRGISSIVGDGESFFYLALSWSVSLALAIVMHLMGILDGHFSCNDWLVDVYRRTQDPSSGRGVRDYI